MRNFLARMAYWRSLFGDLSEYPIAPIKRKERRERLRQRLGDAAFAQSTWDDAAVNRDPAAWAAMAVPMVAIGLLAAIVVLLVHVVRVL